MPDILPGDWVFLNSHPTRFLTSVEMMTVTKGLPPVYWLKSSATDSLLGPIPTSDLELYRKNSR